MLQQYHPWGKPGAGVPRVGILIQYEYMYHTLNTLLLQQSPSGTLCVRKAGLALDSASPNMENLDAYYPFGRPGAGAPRRTESGNVITSIPINPNANYQQVGLIIMK